MLKAFVLGLSSEKVATPVGVSAVTSPWWLPGVQTMATLSDYFSLALPILGAVLLCLQIGGILYGWINKR